MAALPYAQAHPDVVVTAGADPDPRARDAFARCGAAAYPSAEELVGSPDVDAVYVASPTTVHLEHVLLALRAGKHVVVEKPMAPSLAEAEAMVAEAERLGRVLLVGHSQSFEAPVRAMQAVVASGVLGQLRAVNCWYYTDWMYRPRHRDELDAAKGGGVPMRQGAHHVDIIRFLGGGLLRSVRGRVGTWDPSRKAAGAYTAYLEFEDGTPVSAFYSGYDHFPSTELTFGIGESGQQLGSDYAVARGRLARVDSAEGELALKRGAGGVSRQSEMLRSGDRQPFFGLVILSCEHGDLRVSPEGLIVYGDTSRVEVSLAGLPVGRQVLLDELVAAVRGTGGVTHDGRWGVANVEVCEALVRSSDLRQEVVLSKQVVLPAQPALAEVVRQAAAATAGVRDS
ncbi:MAG: phthalate 4,5-cis-dihydrodiol dehydrogenase [Actinomycetota bacterium]|nr:phthalate 4,5-cis-dihydrodiol dehydrogenase [Actinomycetota bacterium]